MYGELKELVEKKFAEYIVRYINQLTMLKLMKFNILRQFCSIILV